MRHHGASASLFVLLFGFGTVGAPAAQPVPYKGVLLEDQLSPQAQQLAFARWLEHSLSPDGKKVAYVAKRMAPTLIKSSPTSIYSTTGVPDPYAGTTVWVMDLATRQHRAVMPGDHNTWNARWSPDGRQLAFLSDKEGRVNLFVLESGSGEITTFSQRMVQAEVFPENSAPFEWAASGRDIVFQAPVVATPKTQNWAVEVYNKQARENANPFEWMGKGRQDVCVANLDSKDVRVLVSNAELLNFRVAPRGDKVALVGNIRQTPSVLQNLMDVFVVEISGNAGKPLAWETLTPQLKDIKEWTGQSFSWSPDGTKLAFLTSGAQATGDVFVWDSRSGRSSNVSDPVPAVPIGTKALDYSPKFSIWYRLAWMPDNSAVLGLTRRQQGSELWKLPLGPGKKPQMLFQGAARTWILPTMSGTSTSAVARLIDGHGLGVQDSTARTWKKVDVNGGATTEMMAGDMPAKLLDSVIDGRSLVRLGEQGGDLWVYKQGDQPIRVTDFVTRLPSKLLGNAQLVRGAGLDGEEVTGFLILPIADTNNRPAPLIVYVYAGRGAPKIEELVDRGGDSWFRNSMLSNGYAILHVGIPNHFRGRWAGAMLTPVLSQLDSAIQTGAIDPKRVGVYGHSFGGYTVNMLVTHTNRFKAAVSVAGIADLISSALGGDSPDTVHLRAATTLGSQPGVGVTPWDNPARYIENSPVHHLPNVTTPLLLIHGDADMSVPMQQSMEMYHGLVSLDKPVEFVRYRGGDHYLNNSPEMIRDFWRRVIEWYGRYLQ